MDSKFELTAISPIDGRYHNIVRSFAPYFSEFAFIKYRIKAEIEYLIFLCNDVVKITLSDKNILRLRNIYINFTQKEAMAVKNYESKIQHDVKAVEIFLRGEVKSINPDLVPLIHLGLTSEDTNSMAEGMSFKDGMGKLIIPKLSDLLKYLVDFAHQHKAVPLLGRTHGQPAIPTTFGKEFAVYAKRIYDELNILKDLPVEAKCSGAVGNFSAQASVYSQNDWINITDKFIERLGLKPNHVSTQIVAFDSYGRIFGSITRINTILTGFVQDVWRYISDGYLVQHKENNQVGSSTMPQKVNPIDFENAEGNLGIANSIMTFMTAKLPISRLQRDLSDSTVKRSIGSALAYTYIAWDRMLRGMGKVAVDAQKIENDLNDHWEMITEGIQTMLRSGGDAEAYEKLRIFCQGRKLSERNIKEFVKSLNVAGKFKQKILDLSPINYIGLAPEITEETVRQIKEGLS